ncbi:MAG: DUF4214 domain-containing protein [Candidatus Hydromicrobium sp.]
MFKNNKIRIFVTVFLLAFILTFTFPSIAFADQTSDVSSFVTRLYQTCLDRSPDPAGLDNWVNNLISGKVTGGQAAYGFVFSEELKNRNLNNDQFLVIMYRAFFDRPADTGGYNNWMGLLNSGSSREFVFSNFVNSTEFANLCRNYNIIAGNLPEASAEPSTRTQIIGSPIFIQNINQALTLLSIYDNLVYCQISQVEKIEESPLDKGGGYYSGRTVYIDLVNQGYGRESDVTIRIALSLSHEFNHVVNSPNYSKFGQVEFEKAACIQQLNTAINIGAPDYLVVWLQNIIINIYDPQTWWWGISIPING